jgi:hypothetical protein
MGRTMARFVQKWGPEVRELVEAAALDPKRPSARQIHEGLIASATGEGGALSPSDIPPRATIAQWVTKPGPKARASLPDAPSPTHAQDTSRSDDEREFLKRLEDDASV